MSSKITSAEMVELFGEEMPIEAVNLLWNSPDEMTLAEIRAELRKIAAARDSDRNPKGEKPQALSAEHESAVPERQSPNPGITPTSQPELVERVGLALQAAWDDGSEIASGLPPIDFTKDEREHLARAALSAAALPDEREAK